MDIKDIVINDVENDVIVKVTDDNGDAWFNLKNLINTILEFIRNLIKFEF